MRNRCSVKTPLSTRTDVRTETLPGIRCRGPGACQPRPENPEWLRAPLDRIPDSWKKSWYIYFYDWSLNIYFSFLNNFSPKYKYILNTHCKISSNLHSKPTRKIGKEPGNKDFTEKWLQIGLKHTKRCLASVVMKR